VKIEKDNRFSIHVPIESAQQNFELIGIDLDGSTLPYKGAILFSGFSNLLKNRKIRRRISIFASLGAGYETERQSYLTDFSQKNLRSKLGAYYFITEEGWNVNLESSYAALSWGSNQASIQLNTLALDLTIGTKFRFSSSSRWSFNILGGWSYFTSFASTNTLGFKDVNAAQLDLRIECNVKEKNWLFFNLKYAPILNGQSWFTINNAAVSLETGYSFSLVSSSFADQFLRPSLELSRLGLTVAPKQLFLNYYAFSLGYGLRF
jgi:hypothetical protein